jgi:hypothetical protein
LSLRLWQSELHACLLSAMRSLACPVAIGVCGVALLAAGCASAPRTKVSAIEGFISVSGPSAIELFDAPGERDAGDWATCHNVAGLPRLIEEARKIEQYKVRLVVEDIGWPVYSAPDSVWTKTVFRDVTLAPSCFRQPYYWLKSIAVVR